MKFVVHDKISMRKCIIPNFFFPKLNFKSRILQKFKFTANKIIESIIYAYMRPPLNVFLKTVLCFTFD